MNCGRFAVRVVAKLRGTRGVEDRPEDGLR
jgi:hypothetical protein